MAQEKIWVSRALADSSLVKAFTSDLYETQRKLAAETMRLNRVGEPMPAENFSTEFFGEYEGEHFKNLPDFFSAYGTYVVSSALKDVLDQFDLGKTQFYPTVFYQHNRKTRIGGDYFCINFGETKDVFEPDHSPKVTISSALLNPEPNGYWRFSGSREHNDIAVNRAAFEGVDLWLDPSLIKGLFLSNRLAEALKAAKLTRRLSLRKCKVI